jgi:hypothetical protein
MVDHMDKCIDKRGQDYLKNIFNDIAKAMGVEKASEAIIIFRDMMTQMKLMNPIAMKREEELSVLSTSVNPVRLKNNPIALDNVTIVNLYNVIVK